MRKFPALIALMRPAWNTVRRRDIEVCNQFPLFVPNSSGSPRARAELTIAAINQTFPLLVRFVEVIGKNDLVENAVPAEQFCSDRDSMMQAAQLKHSLDKYGSDKARSNEYHFIYGAILKHCNSITAVLEIGIGTNNPDVVSNMGRSGKPGASLRAFRDFLPNAKIHGADIDRRILFSENGIATWYVDQTDLRSLEDLGRNIGSDLDLIIDDGLHAPNANIPVVIFALNQLKPGGWLVVEDIPAAAEPLWRVTAAMLPPSFTAHLVSCKDQRVFLMQRTARKG